MKNSLRRFRHWLMFSTAILLSVCFVVFNKNPVKGVDFNMNALRTSIPYCFGRYVIDLPENVEYLGSVERYRRLSIDVEQMSQAEFKNEISDFEKKLRNTKHVKDPSLLILSSAPDSDSRVFAFWSADFSTLSIDLTGYRWVNGLRYRFHSDEDPTRVEHGVQVVSNVISRLQVRGNGIPANTGFCIRGALLADREENDDEETTITFRLRDKPDVQIEIATSRNGNQPPETLLSRKQGVLSALSSLGAWLGSIHTFREGNRSAAGLEGQEWLLRAPNDHKFQSHVFSWEASGRPSSVLFPQIRIDLTTANYGYVAPAPPSLTDAEALQLWDQILGTLRLRNAHAAN